MISLFGLGDISPQQRDIATATSHVVRDIATAASHGMISVQIICQAFWNHTIRNPCDFHDIIHSYHL